MILYFDSSLTLVGFPLSVGPVDGLIVLGVRDMVFRYFVYQFMLFNLWNSARKLSNSLGYPLYIPS